MRTIARSLLVVALLTAPVVGQQTAVVPSVVGTSLRMAAYRITQAHLVPQQITVHDQTPYGSIIAQYPGEGTTVDVYSTVVITMSLGPQQ
jgi:beta-lactam-binding protein with PASTA domain